MSAEETSNFVAWDPHFYPLGDAEPGEDGLVWLYDAEGEPLLKCRPSQADVIAAALEYAHADVEAIYGVGWGNLTDEQAVEILHKHRGQHPHVAPESGE